MRAIIWQIGLFQRLEGNKEAICKLCIENGEKKYTFSVNNFTTTNLVYHLKSKHKNTEFCQLYLALEKEKENRKIKCEIDFDNHLLQKTEEKQHNGQQKQLQTKQINESSEKQQNNTEQLNNEQLIQITEQLIKSNNLIQVEEEEEEIQQFSRQTVLLNSEKILEQSVPQYSLKRDSLLKSSDLDTELKKAKLEYFRTQTLAAEEQIHNFKIQRKLMELEYEEKMKKRLKNEKTK